MERVQSSQHVAKEAVRRLVRSRLAAMSAAQRSTESQFVVQALLADPQVLAAERVALFVPLPGREVDVFPAVSALRALGKRVLLPRIDGEVLRFVLHEDSEQEEEQQEEGGKHSQLQAHPRLGFLQPPAHAAEEEPDVVVCPGRAFDRAGHRIGFGKGYYDQGLARLQRPPAALIGVCFACQLFDSVPHEEHDRNMTRVLAWQEQ